jgi:tight adherence protein C
MTLAQIVFLAGIFVLVVVGLLGMACWCGRTSLGSAALTGRQVPGHGGGDADQRWLKRIADLTAPVSKLAAPEEGFEKSAIKLRFTHAGIRNPTAPSAFFGIKSVLTLGLPLIAYATAESLDALPKGNNCCWCCLLLAALGYYGPNIVLNSMVNRASARSSRAFPMRWT